MRYGANDVCMAKQLWDCVSAEADAGSVADEHPVAQRGRAAGGDVEAIGVNPLYRRSLSSRAPELAALQVQAGRCETS
jgi:hypothetical protein